MPDVCIHKAFLIFPQGFWSLHFPLYKFLREKLDSGVIGEVRRTFLNNGKKIKEGSGERR